MLVLCVTPKAMAELDLDYLVYSTWQIDWTFLKLLEHVTQFFGRGYIG